MILKKMKCAFLYVLRMRGIGITIYSMQAFESMALFDFLCLGLPEMESLSLKFDDNLCTK